MHYPASHDPAAPRPKLAWFKVAAVGVTLLGLAATMIQARSASEGSTYPRLRFGLVCRNCHPLLIHALFRRNPISLPDRGSAVVVSPVGACHFPVPACPRWSRDGPSTS